MTYTITRTRTIKETFRVEANSEADAEAKLADSDTVICVDGVEQVELSTSDSEIDFEEVEA